MQLGRNGYLHVRERMLVRGIRVTKRTAPPHKQGCPDASIHRYTERTYPMRRLSVLEEEALPGCHFENNVAIRLVLNICNHGFRRGIPDEPAPRKRRGGAFEHIDFGWNETWCKLTGDVQKGRHPGFWNRAFPAANNG